MRSKWKIELLGKYISQQNIRNKELDKIDVYSVTNSDGFVKSNEYFNKEVFSKDLSNYKIVKRNQFAYNPSRINVGSIAYLSDVNFALVSPLYIIFKIDINRIYPDYLLRYLKSNYGNVQIRNNTQGSVRDSLKYKGLENIKVALPPLLDQIRIATILSRAEELIARRKESIRLLDELVKSTFLDMFGDPVRNEKGWERVELFSLGINIENGWSPKCESYNRSIDSVWAVLKLSSVSSRYFKPKENKVLPQSVKPKVQYEVQKEDLLFSRKNTKDLVGACAYVFDTPKRLLLPDTIFRLNCNNEKVSPIYLWILFNSENFSKIIKGLANGSAGSMPNISMTKLKKLLILLPPIVLQNQFASIVEKIESIKTAYRQSLAELENLYGSLSQRAFKGELDLSRVPVEQSKKTYSLETAEEFALKENAAGYIPKTKSDQDATDETSEGQNKRKQSVTIVTDTDWVKLSIKKAARSIQSPFSFDELYQHHLHSRQEQPEGWEEYQDEADEYLEETGVSSLLDEREEYEETKAAVYALLEESFLIQVFDEKEKKILLKVNNETDQTETE